jgi:glycosyltransferase involved in cell wall biosynthesis
MQMNLPRVLIIGQTFNNKTGGGITQSNLFRGWDKDKLAVACTAHLLTDSDKTICDNYYQLGQDEHKWAFPFNYLQKKFPSGILKAEQNSQSNVTFVNGKNFRSKLVDDVFYPFLNYSGLTHCISQIKLSSGFRKWLHNFKPDIIYAQGQDRQRILFALSLEDYLKRPLIFHMMDDWPSSISNSGPLKKFWKKKIDRDFRILLDKSSLLMGISDAMALEYKKRYHKDFITFHNPLTIDFWKQHQRSNYELNTPISILYAGRIGLGIQSSLEITAKAIQLVNEQLGTSIKFVLQTPEKPIWSDNYSCIEYKNLVPYNQLPKVFSEADFLILPYDFSNESLQYIQYSMPTKAPEYMISGTPIILFAPDATAVVKYAAEYGWAYIVTKNRTEELVTAITNLIQNKSLREGIGQKAKMVAEEKHNSINVSNEFKSLICSLTS